MLSGLDWLILAVLVGGLIRGYFVGAVRQIASLIGLLVAFLFAVEFMWGIGDMVVSTLGISESAAPIAGFIVVFLGVYFVFLIFSHFIERALATLSLSVVNRAAGSAVGGFKAALLLSLLFLGLARLDIPEQSTRQASALYGPIAELLPRTIEATENWFPAARRAADELGQHVRSDLSAPARLPPDKGLKPSGSSVQTARRWIFAAEDAHASGSMRRVAIAESPGLGSPGEGH